MPSCLIPIMYVTRIHNSCSYKLTMSPVTIQSKMTWPLCKSLSSKLFKWSDDKEYILLQCMCMFPSLILKIDRIRFFFLSFLLPIMPLCSHATYVIRAHGLCSYNQNNIRPTIIWSPILSPSNSGHCLILKCIRTNDNDCRIIPNRKSSRWTRNN
jgi:hypothetical protein